MVEGALSYRDKVSQLIAWGHWFCLSNILIVLFISSRYLVTAPWPETLQAQAFMLVSWVGQFAFLPFLVFLITLFPLSFLVPSRHTLGIVGAITATAGVSALIVDTQIFATFHLHLNPLVWQLLIDKESNTQATDINLLFILLPLVFLLQLLLARICWKNIRKLDRSNVGKPIAATLMACFFLTHLMYVWADATVYRPITTQRINYPLFYPMTAKSFLNSYGFIDIERHREKASQRSDENLSPLAYPAHPLQFDTKSDNFNLLMIVVEGLRADMFSNQLMPNSYSFAEQHASRFTSHFSGGNDSLNGLYSLFYGLPSSYWSSVRDAGVSPVLLNALKHRNYELSFFASKGFEKAQLTKTVLIDTPYKGTENLGGAQGDQQALNEWLDWQTQHATEQPWFNLLYLNGVASFDNQSKPTKRLPTAQQLLPVYRQSVNIVDQKLGVVYQQLEDQGLLDSTVIVLTSDHGLEFNDRGTQTLGSGSNFSSYQTQVPFILYWPGQPAKTINYDTSHLDLTATLLPELLGVKNRLRDYTSGQPLFDETRRDWILMGDLADQVIYQPQRITLFGETGEYEIRDRDYQKINANADMPVLIEVLNEMKRFYRTDS